MRVAFSGTHRSGKSTLLEHVAGLLPGYATVDEPYHLLEEDGYETAAHPSIQDFEAQLVRSLSSLEEGSADVLFDRCPADILAYLLIHDDRATFRAGEWLERVSDAMKTLDLVVLVPVESPDRIPVPSHEDRGYRATVHEKLEALLIDSRLAGDVEVVRAEGDMRSRVRRVMSRIQR